ncbi:hypothetical protein J6590_019850 [Homalodisca vitripennis]|nr:hypothetical protein J6590_019850 [Homalodisca vitripennis]
MITRDHHAPPPDRERGGHRDRAHHCLFKGLAWTFYTLEEGSLEFYLSSLLQDNKTLQQHYMEQSLMRDVVLSLAWTFYTLEEGSLEFYLSSLLQDNKTLQQHYMEQSLMRDPVLSQRVVVAISTLRAEAANIPVSMESSLMSECPLEPPSLTSPVDSGVALVDSDNSGSDGEKNEVQCNSSYLTSD